MTNSKISTFTPTSSTEIAPGVYQLPLPGLLFFQAQQHEDFRGFYSEISKVPDVESVIKKPFEVQQTNFAHSVSNVARGFHAEQWNKLITVTHGIAYCVWVDVRNGSETFGQWTALYLGSNAPGLFGSVFVPQGIANGYVVVEGPLDYMYLTDALYRDRDPQFDTSLSLFDTELNIEWPIPRMSMLLSQRDKQAVSLAELKRTMEAQN